MLQLVTVSIGVVLIQETVLFGLVEHPLSQQVASLEVLDTLLGHDHFVLLRKPLKVDVCLLQIFQLDIVDAKRGLAEPCQSQAMVLDRVHSQPLLV